MQHRFLLFTGLCLASLLTVSACGNQTATQPSSPAPSVVSPSPTQPSPAAQAPSPATGSQTYRQADGLFEISFPEGYTYQETGSGITFVSGDQQFGGSVDFGSADGQQLNQQQLEESLKSEYEKRLQEVTWQGSEVQPDDSIRVDWVGKDPNGNQLDAVSFVEQRGDTIFILNLFGINKPYQDYNDDAQSIVSTYRVKQ